MTTKAVRRDKSKGKDDLGFWSVQYQVGRNGQGVPKVRTKVDTDGNRIGFLLSAGVPGFTAEMFDGVRQLIDESFDDLNGLDSNSPATHAMILRRVASYCNTLADQMGG